MDKVFNPTNYANYESYEEIPPHASPLLIPPEEVYDNMIDEVANDIDLNPDFVRVLKEDKSFAQDWFEDYYGIVGEHVSVVE